jgi:hypothetical protein
MIKAFAAGDPSQPHRCFAKETIFGEPNKVDSLSLQAPFEEIGGVFECQQQEPWGFTLRQLQRIIMGQLSSARSI